MAGKGMCVCVTGAGGYVASCLIKLLLSQGYTVHGTVRNPEDNKNAHLLRFQNAAEKLSLFKADLLDYDSIRAAVKGCNGLFHIASPAPPASVPNPEVEIVEPAVKGTLRNPRDDKNAHLLSFENAAEKLRLFKADLLDFDSILAAVKGCDGLFHVASPAPPGSVPNPQVEIVEPAVRGTLNVLRACSEANVCRVVLVSSVVAVGMNPNLPKGQVLDESCWSDKEFCKRTNNWYIYSKTAAEAEAEAWDYAETNGLNLVSLCPSLALGPMLQQTPNTSSLMLLNLLKEGYEVAENHLRIIVDVRDVAEAIKLVYETPEARGRYICTSHVISTEDLVQTVKGIYPNYDYPKSFKGGRELPQMSSEKLQGLGWKYRPLEETLVDSVESYKQIGLLN